MLFALKDIQANPFRKIERYPIRRDKIEALKESMATTGFWDNVVARVVNGKAQIAYGHHRLVALREKYPQTHEVELIIRDLTDEQMLQIMSRENMEEWGTSAVVEQETIRAWVEAYAAGIVPVPPISADKTASSKLRYAPSFVAGKHDRAAQPDHPYTAECLKTSTGWKDLRKIKEILRALELIEEKILTEKDFDGLKSDQAAAVADQAQRIKREQEKNAKESERRAKEADKAAQAAPDAEHRRHLEKVAAYNLQEASEAREEAKQQARHIGKTISEKIRKREITSKGAFHEAEKEIHRSSRQLPDINRFSKEIRLYFNSILDRELTHKKWTAKIDALVPYISYLDESLYHELLQAVHDLIDRCRTLEGKLRENWNAKNGQETGRSRTKTAKQLTCK